MCPVSARHQPAQLPPSTDPARPTDFNATLNGIREALHQKGFFPAPQFPEDEQFWQMISFRFSRASSA